MEDQSRTAGRKDGALDVAFPPLPQTVSRVGELIAAKNTNLDVLTDVVKHDASVSVNVLQRSNSAYYGVRREVESIEQAVRLLGFAEVSTLTMIEGMNTMRRHYPAHLDVFTQVVRSAVFTGRFAQECAATLELPQQWTVLAFATGLVYSSAQLVVFYSAPERYAQLVESIDTPLPSVDEERAHFGESTSTLAPQACAGWELPERICEVLRAIGPLGTGAEAPDGLALLIASICAGDDLGRRTPNATPSLLPDSFRDAVGRTMHDMTVEDVASGAAGRAWDYAMDVGGAVQ